MLSAHQLSVSLGRRPVLSGIDLDLRRGAVTGLIGPNGAGKTTLLRALAGILPAAGAVVLDGRTLARWSRRELARTIAYLAQDAPCSWPMAAGRIVALGRLPHLAAWQRPSAEDARAIEQALGEADVLHLAERNVLTLSGGERARVMLARALASGPRFLLADEPVAGLDPAHQLQVMMLLKARTEAGMGIIVTLHDLTLAGRFCDRIVVIADGRIKADGSPDDVLTANLLASVFALRAAHGQHGGRRFIVPWEVTAPLAVIDRRRDCDGRED